MEEVVEIRKEDLFRYTFYNEQHKLTAVLDVEKLKEILDVEVILLEEKYGYKDE